MRTIISSAVAALLATATQAQVYGNSFGTGTSYECYWSVDIPLQYETNYYSGVGPYYDDTIYTSIDDTMHYEEYGFDFSFYGVAEFGCALGDVTTTSDYYYLNVIGEADVLKITPYKQTVWWTRPLAMQEQGNTAAVHAYVGGAYSVTTGNAYISYDENAGTGYGDLWTGGQWTYLDAYTDTTYLSNWDDPVYTVNVVDYLPSNIAQYLGEYQLYEQQLF
jgi:hypothetical protein